MNVELIQDYDPTTGEGPKAGTTGIIQESYKDEDGNEYFEVLFEGFLADGPYTCLADVLRFDEEPEPMI